ncbi:MAG: phenylalanine--tRNA ligase subunit beta [Thermostichales cyanobacterium SZTDM-1c_bins_54]
MRIPLSWLGELVEIGDLSPEALAESLTLAGFEVEDIEDRRTWADGVVVGEIISAAPHPNANKLQVCQVDLGTGDPVTIVCGAANARAGIRVPVATPGTYLPAVDLRISEADKRGVKSAGMICSLAELGLAKSSEGIHEFGEAYPLGADARPYLGLDQVILDITSTANRADALSLVGIAREVGALYRRPVRLPGVPTQTGQGELPWALGELTACPAYSGTLIRGVQIGPSPAWLKQKLELAGSRSINSVVDITNYILLLWGQPLHAFDAQKLAHYGSTVGVRLARPGETLTTLDGQQRSLAAENLVITCGDQPVALAGVMGGEATEVSQTTVDIFLEAALFEPVAIRRSARAQGLRTEASARYERGVDYSALLQARDQAVALILEIAGGELVGHVFQDHRPSLERTITLRLSRMMDILGDEVRVEDVQEVLPALGFQLTPCGQPASSLAGETASQIAAQCIWQVQVPPYRLRDIEREIDLIEEFARIYGYDRFSVTLPAETIPGSLTAAEARLRQIREVFRAVGLTELFHNSLCPPSEDPRVIPIRNPISPEFSTLRRELLPGLIEAFRHNWDQGNGALQGFEIGRVFWQNPDHSYQEADHLGGILGGQRTHHDWQKRHPPCDWYEAKGVLVTALERLGMAVTFVPSQEHPSLHPGRTAQVIFQGQPLGWFGQLHPQVRRQLDLPDQVYAFELELDPLVQYQPQPHYQPYSPYPPSDRDIAFFAPLEVSVASLVEVMQQAGGSLLQSVELFDEYRGQGVPVGQRSLAFRLLYRASDHTLTDSEVEAVHQRVRQQLSQAFAVTLRS